MFSMHRAKYSHSCGRARTKKFNRRCAKKERTGSWLHLCFISAWISTIQKIMNTNPDSSTSKIEWKLTNANSGQNSDGFIWRITLRKERLASVRGKGQSHNSDGARPDYQTLRPKPDEAHKGAKSIQNVGVIASRLSDHAAQLGVANGADHGKKATQDPNDHGHINWACFFQHPAGGHKYSRSNNASHDHCAAL